MSVGKSPPSLSEVLAGAISEFTDRQSEITRQNSTAEMLHSEDDTLVSYHFNVYINL